MGSSRGKLEAEVELKSPADKVWHALKDSTNLFPKVSPDLYKSIEVIEGDGQSVGSVRLVTFAEGSGPVANSKERLDAIDDANKKVAISAVGGDVTKYYKSLKVHVEVIPKGSGSLVKWWCEFEKASADVPDPNTIRDFAVKNFQALDAHLLNA